VQIARGSAPHSTWCANRVSRRREKENAEKKRGKRKKSRRAGVGVLSLFRCLSPANATKKEKGKRGIPILGKKKRGREPHHSCSNLLAICRLRLAFFAYLVKRRKEEKEKGAGEKKREKREGHTDLGLLGSYVVLPTRLTMTEGK